MPPTEHLTSNVSVNLRPGMARDQTIFISICSAAILVAAVALVFFVRSQSSTPFVGDWQCLQCGQSFDSKSLLPGPIDCPKCPGEAVKLIDKECPKCGKTSLVSQMRLTQSAQKEFANYQASHAEELAAGQFPKIVFRLPMEARYRIALPEGKSSWHEQWLFTGSDQAQQIRADQRCPHCQAPLYPARP